MAAPLLVGKCAAAMMPSSLGLPGSTELRLSCAKTEAAFALFVVVVLVVIFSLVKFPTWAKLVPVWVGAFYSFVFVPISLGYQNANEIAYKASGLSKSEWVNMVSGDSRTRFSILASLLSALILSLNSWITRWELKHSSH